MKVPDMREELDSEGLYALIVIFILILVISISVTEMGKGLNTNSDVNKNPSVTADESRETDSGETKDDH